MDHEWNNLRASSGMWCVVRTLPLATMAAVLMIPTAGIAWQEDVADLLETHAKNKQRVLEQLQRMPQLVLVKHFGTDFRDVWRRILIDGPCDGLEKQDFLRAVIKKSEGMNAAWHTTLMALAESHGRLFSAGRNSSLMIRPAADPAFEPFGRRLTPAEALAEMTAESAAEVQAFQTIFETGQNLRGYVHKLESHGQATEFIYAVTDIIYGVLLPSQLDFGDEKVTADPRRVQMFYVKAGEVIALYPHVLHSGSLSVEPDRSFSILIYKKPVTNGQQMVKLPATWEKGQEHLKIAGADKFYLTLEELHTEDLKTNRGFIADKQPIRLPTWQGGGR